MRCSASYRHKFANKPEVIDGNMKALEMAFATVEVALEEIEDENRYQ